MAEEDNNFEERQSAQRELSALTLRDQFRKIARRECSEFFGISFEDNKAREQLVEDLRQLRRRDEFWNGVREKTWGGVIVAVIGAAVAYAMTRLQAGSK